MPSTSDAAVADQNKLNSGGKLKFVDAATSMLSTNRPTAAAGGLAGHAKNPSTPKNGNRVLLTVLVSISGSRRENAHSTQFINDDKGGGLLINDFEASYISETIPNRFLLKNWI